MVLKETVSFMNDPLRMAGNLYMPSNIEADQKLPGIVCIHPGGGIKEQVIGLYARHLVERGFSILISDAIHQGASEGEPRLHEDPNARVDDTRCAADYLSTLDVVDRELMTMFGICAGGGYAIATAQIERRFKVVATVSGVDIGGG
jgi:uncharacterized protein